MSKTTIPTGGITADAINGTLIADDAINSEHYTDGSIDTAHIGNSQVTAAKTSGVGTLVSIGQSNSNSAAGTVVFDNIFTADYMFYKVFGRMQPSTNNYLVQMRLRTGGSSGSDESGTNYKFALKTQRQGTNTDDNNDGSQSGNAFSLMRYGIDNDAELGAYFEMTVCNPYGTSTLSSTGAGEFCHIFGHCAHKGSSGNAVQTLFGGRYDGTLTATGMKFQFTSGNTEEHNIQIYGVKNS